MKTAKDVIYNNSLNFNIIDANAMVIDALGIMIDKNIDYVIIKEGDRHIGILRESVYLNKIILPGKDPNKTKVKDIMTINRWSVGMDEPIYRCLELMDTYNVRHLLVFDDIVLKGVITLHDLLRIALIENIENQLKGVQAKYDYSGNKSSNEPQNMSFDNG